MQLYALDKNHQLVSAHHAQRQTDCQCLECQQIVRLRGGPQRQRHFYHLEPTPFCRHHQKGAVHLQLQSYFLQRLPSGDCQLEYSFPTIRRIADVAWLSEKIIFEIQCSPIRAEEVLARNRDYQQLGWKVVWILHDQRYNQVRLSAAERALRSSPHFFSNMNSLGEGIIYDQFDVCKNGIRHKRLPPLPIDIKEICSSPFPPSPLVVINQRIEQWSLSFAGDLIQLSLQSSSSDYLTQALEIERSLQILSQPFAWHHFLRKFIATPYQLFFRFLLERMCR
jgi:competence protein CoiA